MNLVPDQTRDGVDECPHGAAGLGLRGGQIQRPGQRRAQRMS
jgi:hypothetical protein